MLCVRPESGDRGSRNSIVKFGQNVWWKRKIFIVWIVLDFFFLLFFLFRCHFGDDKFWWQWQLSSILSFGVVLFVAREVVFHSVSVSQYRATTNETATIEPNRKRLTIFSILLNRKTFANKLKRGKMSFCVCVWMWMAFFFGRQSNISGIRICWARTPMDGTWHFVEFMKQICLVWKLKLLFLFYAECLFSIVYNLLATYGFFDSTFSRLQMARQPNEIDEVY